MCTKSVGAVVLLLTFGPVPAGAPQIPSFPSEAKRVTVDVVVTDQDGRPIAGLKREDFVVEENDVVQPILEFEAVDVADARSLPPADAVHPGVAENVAADGPGRSFFVVLDDVNLTPASAARARTAVAKFLEVHVREGDRVTLAPTGGAAWWSGRMTDDRTDLLASLASLRGRHTKDSRHERISDYEAMLIEVRRDRETLAHVAERFSLHGLIGPAPTITEDDPDRPPLDLGQGDALVRATASEVYARAKQRTLATLRSLERAMLALSGGRGRRAVILASEGFIHDEGLPELQRVREAARRSNAVLYFIDAASLHGADFGGTDIPHIPDPLTSPTFASTQREYESMAGMGAVALAEDTGGFAVRNTNDLAAGFGRISGESRTFYLLGYEPSDKSTRYRYRKIQVQVRRPRVTVRARKGYYAGEDPRAATAAPVILAPGEAPTEALRALDSPNAERGIPLRMTTYVLGTAAEGRAKVLLVAEADPDALDLLDAGGDTLKGALESFSSVAARDTGELGRRERILDLNLRPEVLVQMVKTWIPVSHSFELPAGRYQATLVVRDKSSGRVGSIRDEFEVPHLPGLRVTTPILTDTQRGLAGALVPVPIARRKFAPGTRLFCSFAVEGAGRGDEGPRVAVTYEVRRSAGTVVTRAGPTPLVPDGEGTLASRFALTLNRPGIYEMHITARDERSGEEASAMESFIVEASS